MHTALYFLPLFLFACVTISSGQKCSRDIGDYQKCMDKISDAARSGSKSEIRAEETRARKRTQAVNRCFNKYRCTPPNRVSKVSKEHSAIEKCVDRAIKNHESSVEKCLRKADNSFRYNKVGVPPRRSETTEGPSLLQMRAALDLCVEKSSDPSVGSKIRSCIASANRRRRKRQVTGFLNQLKGLFGGKLGSGFGDLGSLAQGFDINKIKQLLTGGINQELSDNDSNALQKAYCTGVNKCKEKLGECKPNVCDCFAAARDGKSQVRQELQTCLSRDSVQLESTRLDHLTDSVVRPSPPYCGLEGKSDTCDEVATGSSTSEGDGDGDGDGDDDGGSALSRGFGRIKGPFSRRFNN